MAYKNFKLTEFIEEIGTELRLVRTKKKLTMNTVVQDLSTPDFKISNTLLGRIETGERRIDDTIFLKLCDYYNVDPKELIIRAARKHIETLQANSDSTKPQDAQDGVLTSEELYDLYQNINTTGKKEIATLLRMMAYMKTFQK